MSKLLTEPRIPKAVLEPKKKTKKVKTTEDKGKVTYTLINETKNTNIKELFALYKEDPFKARVKFQNKGRKHYKINRTVIFEFPNNNFEICQFEVSFGISTTNRIYSSEKKIMSISSKGGKFWFMVNTKFSRKFKALSLGDIELFINQTEGISNKTKSKVFDYMFSKLFWLEMLTESDLGEFTIFNTIVREKLFNHKVLHRYLLKVPNNITKEVLNSGYFKRIRGGNKTRLWRDNLKYLKDINHLTTTFLDDVYFVDTLRMAKTLGKKISCKWTPKRLKTEHDKWAKELTNILLDCEVEYELNIKDIFKEFGKFSGYKLLKTNKDMLVEGMNQKHCVGTYINSVENGHCAIFHVKGYTLQLAYNEETFTVVPTSPRRIYGPRHPNDIVRQISDKGLKIKQFKGKYNEDAPEELTKEVQTTIQEFVMEKWEEYFPWVLESDSEVKRVKEFEELPF